MDMRKKIFIDGAEGTTGLNIFDRLKSRKDLEIITLNNKDRKEINSKIEIMKNVDLTIQCLPDQASKQIYDIIKDFENALIGIKQLPSSSKGGVYLAYIYYYKLFKKIKTVPYYEIFNKRIRVQNSNKILLMFQSVVKNQFNLI